MPNTSFWPDKRTFANAIIANPSNGSLKQVREIATDRPGVAARVIEFHHKYLDRPYREPRNSGNQRDNEEIPTITDE
ncbi:hypothetical protein [Undibacterium sp.]|jgi:hypothetical protein|uniref:hypothetical protein n=1 Tax=Undibacterium sp. TaxID=1914977 RepID=UPI002CDD7E52|nr:hypothetical protein [Undibacterium sp.]HTD03625.1 hypothetical protein [Undibacterium sp.]